MTARASSPVRCWPGSAVTTIPWARPARSRPVPVARRAAMAEGARYRFEPLERRGLVLGLSASQVASASLAVMVAFGLLLGHRGPAGIGGAGVVLGLGGLLCRPVLGRPGCPFHPSPSPGGCPTARPLPWPSGALAHQGPGFGLDPPRSPWHRSGPAGRRAAGRACWDCCRRAAGQGRCVLLTGRGRQTTQTGSLGRGARVFGVPPGPARPLAVVPAKPAGRRRRVARPARVGG